MAKKAASKVKGSEAYVVFARRFRPQTFADVVGQLTVTSALRHALKSGRLAQAWLLTGPRGVGKTSLARILAKALNCQVGKGLNGVAEEPCNECDACASIQNGSSLDVIEMDAATNRGIGDVQKLRENVCLAPSQFRYKVYIVDEVHMLTTEAWNAFLKTLEEPPVHVRFIFATTDPDKIPETILSRCQRFDLRRIGLADIVKRLRQICDEEGLTVPQSALERIAALAKGGLRDAESLLDQAVNLGAGQVDDETVRRISGATPDELVFAILHACADGQAALALTECGKAIESGADPDDVLVELCERLRGALVLKTCGADTSLLEGQTHLKDHYQTLGTKLGEDQLLMLLQLFTAARRLVRDAAQSRLPLEMALVRAARAKELVDVGKLVAALESGPAPPIRPAPTAAGPGVREAPRPNGQGRPAGPESRPAARPTTSAQLVIAPLPAFELPVGMPERWAEVLATVRPLSGGPLIASALSHAVGAQIDLASGTLELAFTPAQGFYRETLEKPERMAALKTAFEKVYGCAPRVSFSRVESSAAHLRALVQQRPLEPERSAPAPRETEGGGATDVVFDDEGALPLNAAPVQRIKQRNGDGEEHEESQGSSSFRPEAGLKTVLEGKLAQPAEVEVDASEVAEHPLVKVLVKRVDGEIRRVTRAPAKN